MVDLKYSITGLSEFTISFEDVCNECDFKGCQYGKKNPFQILIDCKDLSHAKEKRRFEQLQKLQKEADIDETYEQIAKKVKINMGEIFSEIWKNKIKTHKEEMKCLDSRRTDTILVSQFSQQLWTSFAKVMREINKECEKIL
jgi:hypothetical protein